MMRELWTRAWQAFRAWRTWRAGVRIEWCADCGVMLTDADSRCEECRAALWAAAARQQSPIPGLLGALQGQQQQQHADAYRMQAMMLNKPNSHLGARGGGLNAQQNDAALGNIRGMM